MISPPLPLHSLMHRQATTVVCLYESVGIRRLYPAIRRDSLCSIVSRHYLLCDAIGSDKPSKYECSTK
jgi:hypothetical protein